MHSLLLMTGRRDILNHIHIPCGLDHVMTDAMNGYEVKVPIVCNTVG